MVIQLIAAQAKNRVIGAGAKIPWRAEGEQKLFKSITMGGTLVMGRKTYDAIGRPLPGRETIIISRDQTLTVAGCQVASSLTIALAIAPANKPLFIAGGGEIYTLALPLVDIVHLTTIEVNPKGNIFFPPFPTSDFTLVEEVSYTNNLNYCYQKYQRKQEK